MKRKKLLITLGIASAVMLSDALDIPSRLLNGYSYVKQGIGGVFTRSDEKKSETIYFSAKGYFTNLPDDIKRDLVSAYISDDTSCTRDMLRQVRQDKLDSIVTYLSNDSGYTTEQRVGWFTTFYRSMTGKERWQAAKDIAGVRWGD